MFRRSDLKALLPPLGFHLSLAPFLATASSEGTNTSFPISYLTTPLDLLSAAPIFSRSIAMKRQMSTQKRANLNNLIAIFNSSMWLRQNHHEPRIGDVDAPQLAELYGRRGRSWFIVFVHDWRDGTYGCCHEACLRPVSRGGYLTRSLEDPIRHQRYHHFVLGCCNVFLSMVASGESIFARSVNQ